MNTGLAIRHFLLSRHCLVWQKVVVAPMDGLIFMILTSPDGVTSIQDVTAVCVSNATASSESLASAINLELAVTQPIDANAMKVEVGGDDLHPLLIVTPEYEKQSSVKFIVMNEIDESFTFENPPASFGSPTFNASLHKKHVRRAWFGGPLTVSEDACYWNTAPVFKPTPCEYEERMDLQCKGVRCVVGESVPSDVSVQDMTNSLKTWRFVLQEIETRRCRTSFNQSPNMTLLCTRHSQCQLDATSNTACIGDELSRIEGITHFPRMTFVVYVQHSTSDASVGKAITESACGWISAFCQQVENEWRAKQGDAGRAISQRHCCIMIAPLVFTTSAKEVCSQYRDRLDVQLHSVDHFSFDWFHHSCMPNAVVIPTSPIADVSPSLATNNVSKVDELKEGQSAFLQHCLLAGIFYDIVDYDAASTTITEQRQSTLGHLYDSEIALPRMSADDAMAMRLGAQHNDLVHVQVNYPKQAKMLYRAQQYSESIKSAIRK